MNKIDIFIKDIKENLKSHLPKVLEYPFFGDFTNRVLLVLSSALLLAVWIVALYRFRPSDFLVPVRYSSFFGVTQLGSWYDLYAVPLIMTFCIFLNLFLGYTMYQKDKMISYIFVGSAAFISAISLIIVINFSIIIGR